MPSRILTLVAFVVACNQEPLTDAPPGPGPAEVAATVPKQEVEQATERMPFDHVFLDAMIQHHKRGGDAAKIAVERAEHPELKAMAESMITSEDAQIAKMKELRQTWYGTPGLPASILPSDEKAELNGTDTTKEMSKDLGGLKDANPFDLAFIDAMVPHHQGAVEMAKEAAVQAQQPETKALASIIARDEQMEIDQMRAWRDAWYPTAQATRETTAP
jgi:uncharacterized protein (DUF305 family)